MTENSARDGFASAADAALMAPFNRAVHDLAAWGERIRQSFPHADVEFHPQTGTAKKSRAALRVSFERAVIGDAKEHAAYAGFWITAEHNPWRGDVIYEVLPYQGPDDRFGKSGHSSTMPRWLGFFEHHTFWSLHGLPLADKDEGFRREIEFSADGQLPPTMRNDLNRLYYYGYSKGIFEDPVEVLSKLPLRPGLIPE